MPTIQELSDELSLSIEEIKDLMCKARQPTSLEVRIGEHRDTLLIDMLEAEGPMPVEKLEQNYIKDSLKDMIAELPEQQAAVISMRYGVGDGILEPLSMSAIGQILHMSRDRVRNLEHKALRTLKQTTGDVEEYL